MGAAAEMAVNAAVAKSRAPFLKKRLIYSSALRI
jgi:hypothetical protein